MKYVAYLFGNISKAPKSHALGWSQYWANHLGAEILRDLKQLTPEDTLYVEHGVNYAGSINLFGGIDDKMAEGVEHLVAVKPKVVSLDRPMPDYAKVFETRIGKTSTSGKVTQTLVNEWRLWLESAETLLYPLERPKWIAFGDSHTTAFAPPGAEVHRVNGLTLHGLLGDWPNRFIDLDGDERYHEVRGITICAGSIDIRHHLMRQDQPKKAVDQLASEFVTRAVWLQKGGLEVELCSPVPVEHEGRKLPKTGYYKDAPFYGTQVERSFLTSYLQGSLSIRHAPIVFPPRRWYDMDPEEYAKTYMELTSSVHIAPPFYRSNIPDAWEVI